MADVPSRAHRRWRLGVVALVVCLVVGGGIAGAGLWLARFNQRMGEESAARREEGHFFNLVHTTVAYLTEEGRFAPDISGLLQVPMDPARTWEHLYYRATPAEVERLKALVAKDARAITEEDGAFITGVLDVTYHAAGLPYDLAKREAPASRETLVISRKLPTGDYRLGFSSGLVVVEPAAAASKTVHASNDVRKKAGLPEVPLK